LGPKQILNKLTGRDSFEVDESFVFEEIGESISSEDREVMNLFVEQSQSAQGKLIAEASEKDDTVKGAFYRICDVPTKPLDDSPLEAIEHPDRFTGRKNTIFGHEGQMIRTDGKRNTKLTKVYKRDDNRGALLKALKRMKLNI